MKTMVLKVLGKLLITVHGEAPMSEADGRAFLDVLKGLDIRSLRVLVCTLGGAPTAAQRKVMADIYRGSYVPTAILSDGRLLRGFVTAMAWFNPGVRSFPIDGLADALAYLAVPRGEWPLVEREVEKMLSELETPSVVTT
jgi:hypothetical protein